MRRREWGGGGGGWYLDAGVFVDGHGCGMLVGAYSVVGFCLRVLRRCAMRNWGWRELGFGGLFVYGVAPLNLRLVYAVDRHDVRDGTLLSDTRRITWRDIGLRNE